jgi:anti-anti-sigma factor
MGHGTEPELAAVEPTAILHCGPLTATVVRVAKNRLRIELAGRLDIDSVKQLDRRLFLPRRADIDLDLSQLDFIDEAGLGFLLMLAQKKGGKAEAIACSPVAQRALELGGLSNLMQRPSSQPG